MSALDDYMRNKRKPLGGFMENGSLLPVQKEASEVEKAPEVEEDDYMQAREDTKPVTDLKSLAAAMNPEYEEREAKRKQKMQAWAGFFDGLRHLSNLYYTSKGAAPQQYTSSVDAVGRVYDDERKRRLAQQEMERQMRKEAFDRNFKLQGMENTENYRKNQLNIAKGKAEAAKEKDDWYRKFREKQEENTKDYRDRSLKSREAHQAVMENQGQTRINQNAQRIAIARDNSSGSSRNRDTIEMPSGETLEYDKKLNGALLDIVQEMRSSVEADLKIQREKATNKNSSVAEQSAAYEQIKHLDKVMEELDNAKSASTKTAAIKSHLAEFPHLEDKVRKILGQEKPKEKPQAAQTKPQAAQAKPAQTKAQAKPAKRKYQHLETLFKEEK